MMDFRGASWVGDICQKFEAMYLEVEETICEDAVKFAGSQVQNVGSNMKKFYTDVMQDLASPDSTAPDTKIDENKKSGNKEDTKQVGNQYTNDLKVIDQVDGDQVSSLAEDKTFAVKFAGSQVQNVGSNMKKFYTDVMQDLASPDSTAPDTKIDENKKSGNKEDTKQVGNQYTNDLKVIDQVDGDQVSSLAEDKTFSCTDVEQDLASPDSTAPDTKIDESMKSGNKEDTKQVGNQFTNDLKVIDRVDGDQVSSLNKDKPVSCTDVKQDLASPDSTAPDTKINESKKSLVPEIILEYATPEHMASIGTNFSVKSNALGDLKTCQFTGELVALSDTGKKVVSKTNDSTDLKGETTNEDTIKLEEGCVFVNENNISFSSYKDGKPWSYKKKMTEALSLKKKSSRRQEYKKLITQYESVNTSSSLACVETVPDTVSPQSNTSELSDWELL